MRLRQVKEVDSYRLFVADDVFLVRDTTSVICFGSAEGNVR